uniref:UBX domain-containing protein 1-like n=1 Tax=Styela clava TaxID=7725 RepID=UPI001939C557|nr:UBX domain-containing protein 1-like [Styela clava]
MATEEEKMDVVVPEQEAGEVVENTTLTNEEKAERLRRAEERIKQRKIEIQEEERKKEVEREKQRRKQGQDLVKIKSDIEWREAQKLAEERKREKREDRLARQRVLDEIAQDRVNMKAKQAKIKQESEHHAQVDPKQIEKQERQRIKDEIARDRENTKAERESNKKQQTADSTSTKPPVVHKNYNEAKLQIRLPNNDKLIKSFGADEPLSAVRLYITMNSDNQLGPFIDISTSYPRKIFNEDEMQMSLRSLNLIPTAVILATKKKEPETAI